MQCPSCRRSMINTANRKIKDSEEPMTISRWRCRPCQETTEEIFVNAKNGRRKATRIRYAVGASCQQRRSFEESPTR